MYLLSLLGLVLFLFLVFIFYFNLIRQWELVAPNSLFAFGLLISNRISTIRLMSVRFYYFSNIIYIFIFCLSWRKFWLFFNFFLFFYLFFCVFVGFGSSSSLWMQRMGAITRKTHCLDLASLAWTSSEQLLLDFRRRTLSRSTERKLPMLYTKGSSKTIGGSPWSGSTSRLGPILGNSWSLNSFALLWIFH